MFTVAKILTDWIIWNRNNVEDEWATWGEWQRQQSSTHYEKSDLFQYYLSRRPNFLPPETSCLNDYHREYYVYCFGDFASLIVNPHSGKSKISDIIRYISLLLDIYDVCKGTARKVRGDPSGIALLRRVVINRDLEALHKYNFQSHCYPYDKIHAHTVAQYSLSTLLLRLLSHYLNTTVMKHPYIAISMCKQAYDKHTFGIIANAQSRPISSSSPINIPSNKHKTDDLHGHSWPKKPDNLEPINKTINSTKRLRCQICTRICENVWGNFNTCIDCYLKRVCSVCGVNAVVITADGFPKCTAHQ